MNVKRRLTRITFLSALLLIAFFIQVVRSSQDYSNISLDAVLPLVKIQGQGQNEAKAGNQVQLSGQNLDQVTAVDTIDEADHSGSDIGGSSSDGPNDDADPSGGTPLTVSLGDIEFLYPGKDRAIPLTIGNPYGFDIVINKVTVSSMGTPACPARFLSLGTFDVLGPQVNANSTGTAAANVALTSSAPEVCQGEHFAIQVTVEAGRR